MEATGPLFGAIPPRSEPQSRPHAGSQEWALFESDFNRFLFLRNANFVFTS